MADDEVATKAPESDAHEPSMVSSEDTPAQQGASMGVQQDLSSQVVVDSVNERHRTTV